MGYVHDTNMSKVISPFNMFGTVATWTIAAGAVTNTLAYHADATDEAAVCNIFIDPWSNSGVDASGLPVKGSLLKSIEVDFEVLVAACDAVSAAIYKVKRGANGAVAVVSAPTFTYDTGHDTAPERLTLDQHKMILTLDTPVYVENDEYYIVAVTFDKAATTTIDVLCAVANFTFRA